MILKRSRPFVQVEPCPPFNIINIKGNIVRDIKRIPIILAAIQELWEYFPDMRLGQLLENFAFDSNTMFFQEDEVTLMELERSILISQE